MKNSFMKKLFAVALVAAMVLSLVACGNGKQKTKKSDDGRVIINLWRTTFNLETVDEAQAQKVQDAVNARLKELGKNVYVQITDIPHGEYPDKVNTALASKEINLFWTASWESVIGTNSLVPAEAVYDITDLLKDTDLYKSMDAGQWEATKYDGKNFFIPVYKDNVEGYDLMVRQELIDKYNWDFSNVKKLADIEPMLADAKSEGLKYPYLSQKTAMFYRWYINDFDFFTADSATNFVSVDKAKNEVVDTILTPQYAEFCKLMAKWVANGYFSDDDYNKITTDTTTQSKDWAITWWTDIPVNDEADARYNQDVTLFSFTDRWAHSTSALGSCYAVTESSNETQAKAAIEFMGALYTDKKLADIFTFGIEGEDFTYAANGGVTQTSKKFNHSMWESASATIVTRLDNEPENKASLYTAFNGGAKTSPAAGFRFDKQPVEAEYTACSNLFEQYGFALEHGAVKEAEVEAKIQEYQKALDAAGYQKVLAEFQKQYNEWKTK